MSKAKLQFVFQSLQEEGVLCNTDMSLEGERNSDRWEGRFVCYVLHPVQKKGLLNTSVFDLAAFSIKCLRGASVCAKTKSLGLFTVYLRELQRAGGQLACGVGHVLIKTE